MVVTQGSSPRLIVIAASAGGLKAMIDVLAPLPPEFPAAIAIVQHRGAGDPQTLIDLLARRTRLRVRHAEDGMILEAGTVYVCPPAMHMTIEHSVRLIDGPRLGFVKPSADLMFSSVSRAYGDRAIGVVLSGSGADAAIGSMAIARAGGTVIAQDDRTCEFADMPKAATRVGSVELVLTPGEIAYELQRLVEGRSASGGAEPHPEVHQYAAPRIKVVLVDDHQIVLDGLGVLLEGEPDMNVVSKVGDGEHAVQAAREFSPDVIVMDIRMPGIDGLEATRQIVAANPHTRVIALSAESDPRTVDGILRAGASGYLTKQRAFGELVQAIRAVTEGRIYLSDEIARMVVSGAVASPIARPQRRL